MENPSSHVSLADVYHNAIGGAAGLRDGADGELTIFDRFVDEHHILTLLHTVLPIMR
jgi:hypothetical protein